MIKGYSRVSTSKQDLQSQIDKLINAGAKEIYQEKFTGTKKDGRKELANLLESLNTGDKVIVTKIDRLARSITDLRAIIDEILSRGASIQFIDNALTFEPNIDNPMSKLMLNMLGSFAEFERDLIVTRTAEGKAWAKENKKDFKDGRPKRRLTAKYLHAIELMQSNTMKEVAKKTGISEATLYRIKRQYKQELQESPN